MMKNREKKDFKHLGIYIHIPFCVSKCKYCDFISHTCFKSNIDSYFQALWKEMELWRNDLDEYKITTVFIGGGTPSAVDEHYISTTISYLKKLFNLSEDAEISIEINPGTLNLNKARAYYESGINRVSMGIQSMNNKLLKNIGRIHSKKDVYHSFEMLRKVGFNNINGDLIFSLPEETERVALDSLVEVINLNPTHISCYSLIVEEGTKMAEIYNQNPELFPSDEEDRLIYHKIENILRYYGYKQYEISNFATKGHECKHNLVYWDINEYLGFGLNSASFFKNEQFQNTSNLNKYFDFITQGEKPLVDKKILSNNELIENYCIFGIRKNDGIDRREILNRFNKDIFLMFEDGISKSVSEGLLKKDGDIIKLTDKGRDLSNIVELRFILEK